MFRSGMAWWNEGDDMRDDEGNDDHAKLGDDGDHADDDDEDDDDEDEDDDDEDKDNEFWFDNGKFDGLLLDVLLFKFFISFPE